MSKLPNGVDINNLIDNLRIISWEAADIMLNYSKILKNQNNRGKIINNLNLDNPVTLADIQVNEIIINNLNEKYKEIPWEIISEENVKILPNNQPTTAEWLWVLDPLDGTKDFIQGTGNYAMHLALNHNQNPYIGIVLIPEREELWISHGKNFWGEKRDGTKVKSYLSKKKQLKDMILVTSKNHRNETLRNLIHKIQFNEVKIMGSIGCKVSSILRGESDIYICLSQPGGSSPKDWDFAAPAALLKASGGLITTIDNEELTYGKDDYSQGGIIVASSDANSHKNICLEIKEIIMKYKIYPDLA